MAKGKKTKQKSDGSKPLRERFIETACALSADEDEATFKAKLSVDRIRTYADTRKQDFED